MEVGQKFLHALLIVASTPRLSLNRSTLLKTLEDAPDCFSVAVDNLGCARESGTCE